LRVRQEEDPTHHVGRAQAGHADARRQNQAVRDYLKALTTAKPAGRRPTTSPEQVQEQIDAEGDPVKRLELIQRRLDLEDRLASEQDLPDLETLKAEFVAVAADYASRKASPTPPSANSAFPPRR
jgi:hypothetical protein